MRHAPSIGIGLGVSLRSTGGFSGLLDQFAGAAAAYSLQALTRGWLAGDVVKVRRSSFGGGAAEAMFTAAQIANGAMLAWVTEFSGTAGGFVSIWYDQSGNANNATRTTTTEQPKIVDTGVLVAGGLDFDGVDDFFETSVVPSNTSTLIGVANWDVEDSTTMIVGARDSTNQRSYISQASSGEMTLGVGSSSLLTVDITAGNDYLVFGMHSGVNRELSANGSQVSDSGGDAPNNTTYGYSIGALNTAGTSGSFMSGTIAEVIIYDSNQSANRAGIEANINARYGIY